jgi:hypothetical protein
MSGAAAASTFAGSDMQQEKVEFPDRGIVDNVANIPANLEIGLQKVQEELAVVIQQVDT